MNETDPDLRSAKSVIWALISEDLIIPRDTSFRLRRIKQPNCKADDIRY